MRRGSTSFWGMQIKYQYFEKYNTILTRTSVIKMGNNKSWQEYRKIRTHIHCRWEYKKGAASMEYR